MSIDRKESRTVGPKREREREYVHVYTCKGVPSLLGVLRLFFFTPSNSLFREKIRVPFLFSPVPTYTICQVSSVSSLCCSVN